MLKHISHMKSENKNTVWQLKVSHYSKAHRTITNKNLQVSHVEDCLMIQVYYRQNHGWPPKLGVHCSWRPLKRIRGQADTWGQSWLGPKPHIYSLKLADGYPLCRVYYFPLYSIQHTLYVNYYPCRVHGPLYCTVHCCTCTVHCCILYSVLLFTAHLICIPWKAHFYTL